MELVVDRLRLAPLEAPQPHESEPAYTARCLQVLVREELERLGIHGLIYAGAGGGPVRPVYLLGLRFYPDLTVLLHGERLIALEVKYLRRGQRQNSLATALGQASLYRLAGYRRVAMFVVDVENRIEADELDNATELLRQTSFVDLIVRRRTGSILLPHPARN